MLGDQQITVGNIAFIFNCAPRFYDGSDLDLSMAEMVYNVFINIHEYSNDVVFIFAHKVRKLCHSTTLISSLTL